MTALLVLVAGLIAVAVGLLGTALYYAWKLRRARVRAEEEARDAEFDRVAREVHKASPIIKDIGKEPPCRPF